MSEREDAEALDPSSSPKELNERKLPVIRRVNNMPLFAGIGAISLVLIVFLYVIVDRANQQQSLHMAAGPTEKDTKNITKAILSYNELISGVNDGVIPAVDEKSSTPTVSIKNTSVPSESKPFDTAHPSAAHRIGQQKDPLGLNFAQTSSDGLDERQREQIAETKAQRAEAAIFATTSVDMSAVSGQIRPEEGSYDRPKTPIDEYQEKLAVLQSFLNPNAMAADNLSHLSSKGEKSNTRKDPAFISDNESDWRLASSRQASERFAIKSGGVIPAIMISGINSDLPGQVIAQVSQNIYDTASGYDLLIPQGTRLIGSYNSDVLFGQSRVMLRWDRLIFPDASTLNLQGMIGADQMGYSGFKDKVNNHYWRLFGNAFLLSLIGAGYQQTLPEESHHNLNNTPTAREQISINMAENFNEMGSELIRKNLNIQPTIEVRPGYKFNVMINKDIIFANRYSTMAFRQN